MAKGFVLSVLQVETGENVAAMATILINAQKSELENIQSQNAFA